MANYGRFRFQSWGNGYSETGSTEEHHVHHVCKPAILECPPQHNNEGRRMSTPGNILQRLKARQNEHNNRHGKCEPLIEDSSEPALITEGGWERPNRAGWKVPADRPLPYATNDIGTAVNYVQGSAGMPPPPSAAVMPNRWSSASSPAFYAKKTDYVNNTIDHREAAKKYGGTFI